MTRASNCKENPTGLLIIVFHSSTGTCFGYITMALGQPAGLSKETCSYRQDHLSELVNSAVSQSQLLSVRVSSTVSQRQLNCQSEATQTVSQRQLNCQGRGNSTVSQRQGNPTVSQRQLNCQSEATHVSQRQLNCQ